MKIKIKPTIAAAVFLLAAWVAGIFAPAYSPIPVHAAEATLSAYDQSAIEDDLKEIDLTKYPKISSGAYRLLEETGITEYAYSEDEDLAANYYGVYFYVYNPSEREISDRPGANKVNIAVRYNAAGEPSAYGNVSLTLLSHTENHRFYKFKITDSATLYTRERDYANQHQGERRYDVASLQLWYTGDRNATDEYFHEGTDAYSRTYFFTGFSKGCGTNPTAESNLKIRVKELESLNLDVHHTFYRSQTSEDGGQNQLDTVYFSVADDIFEKYGKLQRIKAEWYEFKTREILVTQNDQGAAIYQKLIGQTLPRGWVDSTGVWNAVKALLTDEEYKYLRNCYANANIPCDSLYYVFQTNDVAKYDPYSDKLEDVGGISENALLDYIYNYDATHKKGYIEIGDKWISADLFEEDIDEARKIDNEAGKIQRGYSYYDFDIDVDIQEMISWKDGEHADFVEWLYHVFGIYPTEESREFAPIYILKAEDLIGTDEAVADKLMIQLSEVSELKRRYNQAQRDGEQIVMFRFAVSNYSRNLTFANNYAPGTYPGYVAQQSVFLDFDIIQLTFNREGALTAIPVVANPIDIVGAVTPPGKVDHETSAVFNWLGDFIPRIFTGQLEWWEWILFFVSLPFILLAIVILIIIILIFILLIKGIIKVFKLSFKAIKVTGKAVKGKKKPAKAKEDDMT